MVTLHESQASMVCRRTCIKQCSWLYHACVGLSVSTTKHLPDIGALSSVGHFFLMPPPRGQLCPPSWSGMRFRGGPYIGHTAIGDGSRMQTQATPQVWCGTRPLRIWHPLSRALASQSCLNVSPAWLPHLASRWHCGHRQDCDQKAVVGRGGDEEGM